MEIILLENVRGLGKLGDIVVVKNGFARNFLLPCKKALLKNASNLSYFETKKAELEMKEIERTKNVDLLASKIKELDITLKMKASDEGHLYASVTSELVMKHMGELAKSINKHMIVVPHGMIRNVGIYTIEFHLSDTAIFEKQITVEKE